MMIRLVGVSVSKLQKGKGNIIEKRRKMGDYFKYATG
jgi:hypothetical protein